MAKILNIHILGIAGTMTAPLACALMKLGHHITGSDQSKIYPPTSNLLSGIEINKPLSHIDLAIIGSSYKSFKNCVDEFEQIKKNNIPFISATEYIAQNLIKNESILVAGSYGKTTITSLLSWLKPGANYFFGGIAINSFPSLNITNSNWSIVEADESINGLDTQAKFLYYPVKYLILTSAKWEHKESYGTSLENFNSFKQLIERIPKNGLLVYNPLDLEIQKLLPFCQAKTIPYQKHQFKTMLIGQHNQENINAALTLCNLLNIDTSLISTFAGIKRRLEIVSNENDILVIDDFAQSANRVQSALDAIKETFPDRPIKIYFEPHASFLQNKKSVTEFSYITQNFTSFVLGKINYSAKISKNDRVTINDWQSALHNQVVYLPTEEGIISHFRNTLRQNDILIHFSSGGLDGLNSLKKVYNN